MMGSMLHSMRVEGGLPPSSLSTPSPVSFTPLPRNMRAYQTDVTLHAREGYKPLSSVKTLPLGPCLTVNVVAADVDVVVADLVRQAQASPAQIAVLPPYFHTKDIARLAAQYCVDTHASDSTSLNDDAADSVSCCDVGVDALYPVPVDGMLVLRNVCHSLCSRMKAGDGDGKHAHAATCAPPSCPGSEPSMVAPASVTVLLMTPVPEPRLSDMKRLMPVTERVTESKIALALAAARHCHCSTLVIGPWGCGAFGNPPVHVAELFRSALLRFGISFTKVVFAIPKKLNRAAKHSTEASVGTSTADAATTPLPALNGSIPCPPSAPVSCEGVGAIGEPAETTRCGTTPFDCFQHVFGSYDALRDAALASIEL